LDLLDFPLGSALWDFASKKKKRPLLIHGSNN
jgi:hypothetical protein